jgi:hypothetical protein
MTEERTGPTVVCLTQGAPLAPEPHVAVYHDEIPESVLEQINRAHPQDVPSQGRLIAAFNW